MLPLSLFRSRISARWMAILSLAATPAIAQDGPGVGAVVGWGRQVVVAQEAITDLVEVAGGAWHSVGLKSDGSIVAWGSNGKGQANVPAPNSGFVAVAGGGSHSLGLKDDGSIVAWGSNNYGQTNVPAPNTGFVAVAAGAFHNLGLWTLPGVPPLPSDCNADGQISILDYAALPGCLSGPGVLSGGDCACYELDGDADVDLRDVAAFTNAIAG